MQEAARPFAAKGSCSIHGGSERKSLQHPRQCARKRRVLLLRAFGRPLGVLARAEELFVLIEKISQLSLAENVWYPYNEK